MYTCYDKIELLHYLIMPFLNVCSKDSKLAYHRDAYTFMSIAVLFI